MIQHRYRTATVLGRWCPTREQACADAVRVGFAKPVSRKPDSVLWLVPGEIETR